MPILLRQERDQTMQPSRLVGPGSGVAKYDVLTALSVGALHRSPAEQVSVLRLIALITARYNWQRDELCLGQSEMARIWGVHDRTVKREVRRLQEAGLLVCLRPGVRGRVASYRLDRAGIERFSRPVWDLLGADFASRAGQVMGTASATNVTLSAEGWKTFFRGLANDGVQGPAVANYIKNTLGAKKVCVIDDGTDYGLGLAKTVRATLGPVASADCEISVKKGDKDFAAAMTQIKAQAPDAVR